MKSVRELYQDKKITVIFQPHLYTRTRDFYRDFAASLSLSDEVILTEIYPAREQPIPGVTSQLIYDCLLYTSQAVADVAGEADVQACTLEDVINERGGCSLSVRAGDTDHLLSLIHI